MEQIEATGSISRAAKQIKLSYKAAWDAVDAMNNLSERPLVVCSAGGAQGGGTRLTDFGREMLHVWRRMQSEYERFLAQVAQEAVGRKLRFRVHARDVSLALGRCEDSSITNVIAATVCELAAADTPAHVLVRLEAAGTPLLARITRRSSDHLGLAPGRRLWAQIKAVALLG